MVNPYILFLSFLFIFTHYFRVLGHGISETEKINILLDCIILQNQGQSNVIDIKNNDYPDFPEYPEYPEYPENPQYPDYPEEKEDNTNSFYTKSKLLEREKEMKEKYDNEYKKYIEQQNKLKSDSKYILTLIIIVCILFFIIVIHICYEVYRNKKGIQSKIGSIDSTGFDLSSSQFKNSTYESNKRNQSSSQSQKDDLNDLSNFNILLDKNCEEGEIILNPYNDAEEAPIQFYYNNNSNNNNYNNNNNNNNSINNSDKKIDNNIDNIFDNNIINNIYNDDEKTLTNNEDIFFANKTDKLLYKPYSEEEINK